MSEHSKTTEEKTLLRACTATARGSLLTARFHCLLLTAYCLLPVLALDAWAAESATAKLSYTIVDTGQIRCYSDNAEIEYPKVGAEFFGQDAQYAGNEPAYTDNGDGTVSDLITGLMWQGDPGAKKTFKQAVADAAKCKTGGHDDWRLPTIKELYSLILFSGTDPDPMSNDTSKQRPFIDKKFFKFQYGDAASGERIIDSQFATCTQYVSTTMRGNETMFGVNFADGRIKGYPSGSPRGRGEKTYHVLYVRGNPDYGKNIFHDNGDGTISDKATGLMWMQVDSGALKAGKEKDGGLNWGEALQWAEQLEYAGHSDWRLPSAKELQSILDYTRAPAKTNSAAIDPLFQATSLTTTAVDGKQDYHFYWTGTTHASVSRASTAAYLCFGRGTGWMQDRRSGQYTFMDVHGAGAQRSDPKSGDAAKFPHGRGPQGDVIHIYNAVRCVRGGAAEPHATGPKVEMKTAGRRPGQMGRGPGSDGGRPQGPPGGGFVQRLDRDNDGRVSRTEFDGPADAFGRHDRNQDGYLSEDEAPRGRPGGPPGGPRGL